MQEEEASDRVEERGDGQVSTLLPSPDHSERNQREGTDGGDDEVSPPVGSDPRGGEGGNSKNPKGDSATVSSPDLSQDSLAGRLGEMTPAKLRQCQQADPELVHLFSQVDKVGIQPGGKGKFFLKKGLLFRSEGPGRRGIEDSNDQLVVPLIFRQELLCLAHAAPWG